MSPRSRTDAPTAATAGVRAAPSAASEGDTMGELRKAAREMARQAYVLKLYVTGATRASQQAIERVRSVCEKHLRGRYELEVIDIYQLPALAKGEQIVATPTLIKLLPTPLRRYIGNLANIEKILFGIDVREKQR